MEQNSKPSKTGVARESVVETMINTMLNRDYEAVRHLCSPDFQAIYSPPDQGHSTVLTREEWLKAIEDFLKRYPKSVDRILDIDIVRRNNKGDVNVHTETRLTPDGPFKENTNLMEFRRVPLEEGRSVWQAVKYQEVRGMAGPALIGGGRPINTTVSS
ncbi:Hypothetical predicted protein [Lecanosticta acicola]|uniref:SnoaL-like domain-containing protein n=1 Tax=Lecanosticta acicola TaxID=111012 RepID=A0AAI8YW68_9PEZI|nr:Hypothetical predicted protein [Lecanosticta acicola]